MQASGLAHRAVMLVLHSAQPTDTRHPGTSSHVSLRDSRRTLAVSAFEAEETSIPFFSLLSLAFGAIFLRYAFLVHLW
jgi:hypothetical protein